MSDCNQSLPCNCFKNPSRANAISAISQNLSSIIIKPIGDTLISQCKIDFNKYINKLIFTTINLINSKCMCSLSENLIDKIILNTLDYSETNFLYNDISENNICIDKTISLKYKGHAITGNVFIWDELISSNQNWDFLYPQSSSPKGVLHLPYAEKSCYKLEIQLTGTPLPSKIIIKDISNPDFEDVVNYSKTDNNIAIYISDINYFNNQNIYITYYESINLTSATLMITSQPYKIRNIYAGYQINSFIPTIDVHTYIVKDNIKAFITNYYLWTINSINVDFGSEILIKIDINCQQCIETNSPNDVENPLTVNYQSHYVTINESKTLIESNSCRPLSVQSLGYVCKYYFTNLRQIKIKKLNLHNITSASFIDVYLHASEQTVDVKDCRLTLNYKQI
jgi:hypothetical protein